MEGGREKRKKEREGDSREGTKRSKELMDV